MDQNTELLNFVHKNVKMGIDTIAHLLDIVDDDRFKVALMTQKEEYRNIADEAERMAGTDLGENGTMAKFSAYMMIEMKTIANQSPSHIAQMMIQGSTMGVVQATKHLKEQAGADEEVRALTQRLIETEQDNIETMKSFLGE